ncbi:hypothetical protein [Flavobacterium sp.]|uniref:hypothetical protein n=1 Tax=Flavobacterium sp. TaxID=239 RepID=UPI0039E494E4
MTTKLFSLAGIAMLFFSCSDDDPTPYTIPDFSHFTLTSTTTLADGSPSPDNYSYTENLLDGKRFSVTQDGVTTQRYFYDTNMKLTATPDTRLYYNNQLQLIGAQKMVLEDGVLQQVNYRFVHASYKVTYAERLDGFYTDPEAQIVYRNILEFEGDNVVKAGPDSNLDGMMDHVNRFTYSDGDLVKIQLWDGSEQNFSYSTLYDNFNKLDNKTYGIETRRVLCAEQYVGTDWPDNLGHSMHVLANDPDSDYVVSPTSIYYQKKTTLTPLADGVENETVIEFFFNQ